MLIRAIAVFIGLLAGIAAAAAAFVWSGIYNVAADAPHTRPVDMLFDTVRARSVRVRARNVDMPSDLDLPARVAAGAKLYAEMCETCHLAPGVGDNDLRRGLYPQPPKLGEGHGNHAPRETFWIIKHGIKMTGMPAWGNSHRDEDIWNMVAFVARMPDMKAAEYREIVKGGAAMPAAGDIHDRAHGAHR